MSQLERACVLPVLLYVALAGCAWLADHKPTDAEKAQAAAVARCVASAVHDGAGGAP